jgi:hypothetical protein
MHQKSEGWEIKHGCEILIGIVRFHCFYEEVVVERDYEEEK